MKKALVVIIPCVASIIMLVICYVYWYFLPFNVIKRAFKENDYTTVVENYKKLELKKEKSYVQEKLEKRSLSYYVDYQEGMLEYEVLSSFFELIIPKVFDKNSKPAEYYDLSQELLAARLHYAKGEELYADKRYIEAIEELKQVSGLDYELRNKAGDLIDGCKRAYCEAAIATADEYISIKLYIDAKLVVSEALQNFPGEPALMDKMKEIRAYLKPNIPNAMYTTYDLGELIAKELKVSEYKLYFPAKIVLSTQTKHINIFVDEGSISTGIDALTSDPTSMEAIYKVAEDYGISESQADFLINVIYGGSYSKYIMKNFGGEIEKELALFAVDTRCYMDQTRIYIGTDTVNEDNYLEYVEENGNITLISYTGDNAMLSMLKYPVTFTK